MGRKAAVFEPVDPEPTQLDLCRDGCLSLKRAARFCGVTLRLFRSEVLPLVPTVRIGRRVVVPSAALARLLADRLVGGKGGPA